MPSSNKTVRQQVEYNRQSAKLQLIENAFVRKCILQQSLSKKELEMTVELTGYLNKINRIRKQRGVGMITNVEQYLPNRPVPDCILKALHEDIPRKLRRNLTHRPTNINCKFWEYEKTQLGKWAKA